MNKKTQPKDEISASSPNAILLIGPTGAGKTPLGEYLEKHGINGQRCSHFDFGATLRHIDSTRIPVGSLTNADADFIHKVLTQGALLENDKFHIAAELLKAHIYKTRLTPNEYILLNGLPRHIEQAKALDDIITVTNIIHLHCTPATVYSRIRHNTGGDRTTRTDDSPENIATKLTLFEKRTKPMLEHYAQKNIAITTIKITTQTTPGEIYRKILSSINLCH